MNKYSKVTAEIADELRVAIGTNNVIYDDAEALESYSSDASGAVWSKLPEAVVRPENTQHVSAIMKIASKYKIPVTPRSAGSGLAGAAVPLYGGIVISMERMNRIIEIDPLNRVVVAEAGVITNDLCKAVAEKGFLYAGYPMSTEMSFIGANVATNAGGAKVIRYGNTRKHVLGLEVVLASGEVLQLGGKYRKDTWGYSLMQLIIGSEGTLAVITKVILNLEPPTGKIVNLLGAFESVSDAVNAVSKIVLSGERVIACEFMDKLSVKLTTDYLNTELPYQDRTEAYLIIQVEGENEEKLEASYDKIGGLCLECGAFEVFVAETRTESAQMWLVRQNLLEGILSVDPQASTSGDIVVPFDKVPEMLRRTHALADKFGVRAAVLGHFADGNLHPEILKPDDIDSDKWVLYSEKFFEELIGEAIELGGVGSGEHGAGFLKKDALLNSKSQGEIAIQRSIKAAFDPDGIVNPGKVIDG